MTTTTEAAAKSAAPGESRDGALASSVAGEDLPVFSLSQSKTRRQSNHVEEKEKNPLPLDFADGTL